jgi:hypothetical protein
MVDVIWTVVLVVIATVDEDVAALGATDTGSDVEAAAGSATTSSLDVAQEPVSVITQATNTHKGCTMHLLRVSPLIVSKYLLTV